MTSIYILGAGAMGSLWATHLHHALKQNRHYSVQFLSTRKSPPKDLSFTLNSHFLLDTQTSFEIQIPVIAPNQLRIATPEQPNIILVCTKSYHALDAVIELKPYLNNQCYFVLFQNGLGSQHKIIDSFPDNPIYAAVSTEGVYRQSNQIIVHAGKGLTRIGSLNHIAEDSSIFDRCLKALRHQGLDTQKTVNIWPALWEKLAINCAINPFTAILNCPNGELLKSPLFQKNWPYLKVELTELLNSAGIVITDTELEKKVITVIEKTRNNISSMLQDARANRKTEIEDINGFAANYLEQKGLKNKVNSMLAQELNI